MLSSQSESAGHPVPEPAGAHGDRQERRRHYPRVAYQIPPIWGSVHSPLKNKKQGPEKQYRPPNVQGGKGCKVLNVGKPAQRAGLDYDRGQ